MKKRKILTMLVLMLFLVCCVRADWIDDGDNMYSDVSGNVGIGTDSPKAKLHIVGDGTCGSVKITGSPSELRHIVCDAELILASNMWIFPDSMSIQYDADNRQMHIYGVYDGYRHGPHMTITGYSGNVGIGTTSPEAKLHLAGWATDAYIDVNDHTGLGTSEIYFREHTFCGGKLKYDASNDVFQMLTVEQWEEKLGISIARENGNVGIGTTLPEAKLHVIRDDVDTGHYDRYTSSVIEGTEGRIQLIGKDEGHASASLILTNGQESFNSHWSIAHLTSSEENKLLIGHTTTSSSPCDAWSFSMGLMTIDTSGNVGIGTMNPQGKLDVNGSIYQRGNELNADYVFEPGYKLETIDEHSQFMWENAHLKAIPKAQVDANGQEIVEVGAHRKGIVEELEKAHIYIEQLNNRIKVLEEKLAKLEAGISSEQ